MICGCAEGTLVRLWKENRSIGGNKISHRGSWVKLKLEIMREGLRVFASLGRGCQVQLDVVPVLVFSTVKRYGSFSATAEPMTSADYDRSEMRNQWAQQVLSSPADGRGQGWAQGIKRTGRQV